MKLELKHLAPYLPYGLIVQWIREDDKAIIMSDLNISDYNFLIKYKRAKPILRPLSDLTKEIEVNGEKFVPGDTDLLGKYEISVIPVFDFFDGTGSNQKIDDLPYCVIQKLYEWHFDIYGLIENGLAVDINTL